MEEQEKPLSLVLFSRTDDKLMATSVDLLGLKREDLIYGLDEPAGAT